MQDDKIKAGLPGSKLYIAGLLRAQGLNPDRLSIFFFGESLSKARWLRGLLAGCCVYVVAQMLTPFFPHFFSVYVSSYLTAILTLISGFLILHGACQALIKSTLWLAAKWKLTHYFAGTLVELAGTIPELVVITFLAYASPMVALVTALLTIYTNTLLFSLYSFFLPKNHQHKFVMPTPITEAGTQALVAGSVIAISCGFALLAFSAIPPTKTALSSGDLLTVAFTLLIIFGFYLHKLMHDSRTQEKEVKEGLKLNESQVDERKALVYREVDIPSVVIIAAVSIIGVGSAFFGGYLITEVATLALGQLHINVLLTGIILAFCAGMSEIILLISAHRQGEYGIALANAFGGITQVLLFVLPFTLLVIASNLYWHAEQFQLPIDRVLVFLALFLFPLFHVFAGLIEEDHSFDLLDTCIMAVMILFLFALLANYGVL